MYCTKCGTQNPHDAQLCGSCSAVLTAASPAGPATETKTSAMAITALILGILSPFTCAITAIPALVLGIISLVKIEKSGGQLTGKGFALTGIIAPVVIVPVLLVAVMMPALYKAKTQAKDVICKHQLHQWGLVWKMYTDDNKGFFVENENWLDATQPYHQNEKLLLCPRAHKSEDEGASVPFAAWRTADRKGSYGLNLWVARSTGGQRPTKYLWRTPNVKGASFAPMFLDCSSPGIWPLHSDAPPEYDGQPKGEGTNEIRDCCINRHNGYVNGAFLDFAVRRIALKELWQLKWHRRWNENNDPPPQWPDWMKGFKDTTNDPYPKY